MKKILLIFLSFLFISSPVYSAENKVFEIEQKEFFLQSSSKKVLNETLVVKNITDQSIQINASWVNSKIGKSIDFVTIEPTFLTIDPFAISNLNLRFMVPENINSGDYYGNLTLKSDSATSEIPVTLRILGQISEKITVKKVDFENGILKLGILNEGNVSTQVAGKVKINNLFNSYEISLSKQNLKASQDYTYQIDTIGKIPGFYRAEFNLVYGSKDYPLSSFLSFWVNPIFFIVSSLSLIFVLIGFLIKRNVRTSA